METPPLRPKVIFFDAVGTLFHLPQSVGYHYAHVGQRMGLRVGTAEALDAAFRTAWSRMPARPPTGAPREDDDKGWWRDLVNCVIDETAPQTKELDRDMFFEVAYEHFAEAGVWECYPEVLETLDELRRRHQLAIISNFDGRLRMIIEQFGLSRHFAAVTISSEVGADKPDTLIFQRALEMNHVAAADALHVGDDPIRDWQGAATCGIPVFKLERPRNSLHDLLATL